MKTQDISYCIHGFMCEKLGLSGSELLIFAIIYSFTKGERGSYYGTLDFLMRASGLSLSTVRRAILKLSKKKYITECQFCDRRAYKTLVDGEPLCHNETEPQSSTKKSTSAQGCEEKAEFDIADKNLYTVRPKYTYHNVGNRGIVSMTPEQYKSLLTLVAPEVLKAYACKLEFLIVNKGYRTFNPYKTIKKWIQEDSSA